MGTYDLYRTNRDLEEEGTWVTMADGSRWKIRRAKSKKAQHVREQVENKLLGPARARRYRKVSDELETKVNVEWLARGVVIDWEGVTGPDGQDLPCNVDNCIQVLTDLEDLALDVVNASADIQNFKDEEDEEDAKNSQTSLDGTTSGDHT